MKKLLYSLLLGSAVAFSSCESKLDEKHSNPDGFTSAEIKYLFTKGAQKTIENDYADTWNYNFRLIGNYIQTTARQAGKDRINLYQNIQDDKARWENYYVTRMSTLTEIDKIYATLSPEEQTKYQNYIEAGKILKAYNTAIATDFFGNMPYTEAFTARNVVYGGTVIFKPKYDTQKDIYYAILDDLKSAAAYFKTASGDDTFKRQDIIYKGDCNGWYKFANSLRLRYAMRISNVDPEKARQVLSELSLDQLITTNAENTYIKVFGIDTAPDGIWRAMRESHNKTHSYYMYAPELTVNMLKEAADPRLVVFYQPATDNDGNVYEDSKEIIGYPSSADKAISLVNGPDGTRLFEIYGCLNTVTFRNNYQLPVGIGMTAAEVYLCLAEAAQRGLYNGNAEEFYNKAVILSVQNYYEYYKNSDAEKGKDMTIANRDVSDETLSNWLATSTFKFNPSKALEQIATQKWLHLGFLQIYENWAEYRRTDLPVLDDDRENGTLLNKENAPVRFLYPAKEASMNTENYNAQSENNKISARLWWDTK